MFIPVVARGLQKLKFKRFVNNVTWAYWYYHAIENSRWTYVKLYNSYDTVGNNFLLFMINFVIMNWISKKLWLRLWTNPPYITLHQMAGVSKLVSIQENKIVIISSVKVS